MNTRLRKTVARFLLCWSPVFIAAPVFAQDEGSLFADEPAVPTGSAIVSKVADDDERVSEVQNAVLEGIQLSSEPGEAEGEMIVSCYFIFRDKPSSYFYEAKLKEKKIVFEFNDTEIGVSPVPSAKEPPIQGFRIEEEKVDINREVQGLNPEWHDVLKVSFFMDAIPQITVKDEYSIISYSFKWTKDPEKVKNYVVESNTAKVFLITSGALAAIGGGILAYVLLQPDDTPDPPKPLDISDLPTHPSFNIAQ